MLNIFKQLAYNSNRKKAAYDGRSLKVENY